MLLCKLISLPNVFRRRCFLNWSGRVWIIGLLRSTISSYLLIPFLFIQLPWNNVYFFPPVQLLFLLSKRSKTVHIRQTTVHHSSSCYLWSFYQRYTSTLILWFVFIIFYFLPIKNPNNIHSLQHYLSLHLQISVVNGCGMRILSISTMWSKE